MYLHGLYDKHGEIVGKVRPMLFGGYLLEDHE
jgi:hypothetical protein